MSLTLDALIVLDTIDRKGSFAAAAEALFRVPSAISYTMQKLEQELDISIFDRRGHRSILTPAGRALLEEGRHLLEEADRIENHVKRVATGWESRLRIVLDTLIVQSSFLPLLDGFYTQCPPSTQIQLTHEVLSGSWDALISRRADLIIGATGEKPAGGGFNTHPLGQIDMVFAIAPSHPLAKITGPLKQKDIKNYRAVSVADTSQRLPIRTTGLISGQQVLTVADMSTKIDAQCRGLGVGHVPLNQVHAIIKSGKLVVKEVEEPNQAGSLYLAWHSDNYRNGKALQWFIEKLKHKTTADQLINNA